MSPAGGARYAHPQTSSWSPLSLPGLTAWYDASDTASITASSGAVSQWNDKSGNGYHLTQATGANQPTTGVATINGLNVIRADDTDDQLTNATIPITTPYYVFFVGKFVTITAHEHALFYASGGGGNAPVLYTTTNGATYQYYGGTGSILTATSTSAHVLELIFSSGSAGTWYVDGGSATAFSGESLSGSGGVGTAGQIGAPNRPTNFDYGEWIIGSGSLGTTDRQAAEVGLKAKWGTP